LIAAAALAGLSLASCEDEPDKYEVAGGSPVVKYVRCLSSEIHRWDDAEGTQYTDGQLVTSASPRSTLCIIGENLRSVKQVWFNDLQAVLTTSYITDNTLIVNIPKDVPGSVTDKIYFITSSKDTVAYDFHVVIPKPFVTTMTNEYAAVGEEVTLYGNYYIDDAAVPLTVNFTGANGLVQAKDLKIAEDYSSITFKIPAGAQEGPVFVTSVYGTTEAPFQYLDKRGMLFTFDDGRINNGWKVPKADGTGIRTDNTALDGNFLQFGNGEVEFKNSWDDNNLEFDYWPGSWQNPETFSDPATMRLYDVTDFSNWETLALKFEICIPESNAWIGSTEKPFDGAPMQIIFSSTDMVTNTDAGAVDMAGNILPGGNNTFFHDANNPFPRCYYRPWATAAEGKFHTGGKWQTVVLPIKANWIYDYDGNLVNPDLRPTSFAGFQIMFWSNAGAPTTVCSPIIKIDNIRVVPFNQ
ncbi:MAG: hypothetical protein KBT29_07700, partial [Prevotellaceae bacterium]|nr:hypothetical protein [Candidatus Minthosoma caballi]